MSPQKLNRANNLVGVLPFGNLFFLRVSTSSKDSDISCLLQRAATSVLSD